MRYYFLLLIAAALASGGCTNTKHANNDEASAVSANSEIAGKIFEIQYLNSAVFDKTMAMYASEDAGMIDIKVSQGMSINDIPERLDEIFVSAVDNGAEFNLLDERDEVKMRSVSVMMALVSAYSNYTEAKAYYQNYLDERAQAKLGNYTINLYYNVENGDISHIMFTHKELTE